MPVSASLLCPVQSILALALRCFATTTPLSPSSPSASQSPLGPHRYDFDLVHDVAKQMGVNIDYSTMCESMGLLLFFGDLKSARVGFTKLLHAHKAILARVRQGAAAASGCAQAAC